MDIFHDILAVNNKFALIRDRTAQCSVQDGTILSSIQMYTGEHLCPAALDVHCLRKRNQILDDLVSYQVL